MTENSAVTSAPEATLRAINKILASNNWLAGAYGELEPLILALFNAERLSIFQRRRMHQDLVAHLKTGSENKEIRVPITAESIAGYVALSQKAIIIDDVNDKDQLLAVHPKLKFFKTVDVKTRFITKSILCAPIMDSGVVLGVLEIINKVDGKFSQLELKLVQKLASAIGRQYRHELGGTAHPFEYLVQRGRLSSEELKSIKKKDTDVIGLLTSIQNKFGIPDTEIGNALSVHYQVPFISYAPDEYHLSPLQSVLNSSYLKRNHIAVIADVSEVPILLMSEPNNASLLLEVEAAIGTQNCEIAVGLPKHIDSYLNEADHTDNIETLLKEINALERDSLESDQATKLIEKITDNTPAIVRLVDRLFDDAYHQGASDIHIDPEKDAPTLIRFRVDGECIDISQVSRLQHEAIVARIKIMANLNIAEKRLPQDGKLCFTADGQKVEVRVATVPTVTGEGIVMRILATAGAMPMSGLNLAPRVMQPLAELIKKPHGIFLVVGPTGSGKTTTLHSILGELNAPKTKIWTAEDPVEITQHRLQQVQINAKIGFTFERALRAFLRADPDIILIGEMRDRETAHAAIEASLTGHLVLSTLHTNSAPETITRLLEMGMDPINFSDACLGVLAQRLIRTLCKHCKQKIALSESDLTFIKKHYGDAFLHELDLDSVEHLYTAKGCERCAGTGYKGRTGVHELLVMTPELQTMVNKGATLKEMSDQSVKDGLRTLLQDSIYKLIKGDTDSKQIKLLHGIAG